jgi:pimeloyl-ACP methyl ester carboxylesterase
MSRREALRLSLLAGAGVAGVVVLGCGGGEKESVTPTIAPTAVPPSGFFDSNGVKIHYETFGEGKPLVLVHGLYGSIQEDWVKTGIVSGIGSGRQLIALDHRGHGESDKPKNLEDYRVEKMGQDVVNLMDHLGVQKADLLGYSMGAFISNWVLINHQDRLNSVILSGTGGNLKANDPATARSLYDALMAEDPTTVTDPIGKLVRDAFDQAGVDRNTREALAACTLQFLPLEQHYEASDFVNVKIPVMIINGEQDTVTGGVEELVAAIPGVKFVTVPGGDHLSVRSLPAYQQEVLAFLKQR